MRKKNSTTIKSVVATSEGAIKKPFPREIRPMLATLTHNYFYEPDWIYERKFDGERCFAMKDGNKVMLRSRNNISINISYPEIKDAIQKLAVKSMVLDGEVVAFDGAATSFERLQSRMHVTSEEKIGKSRVKVYFYIFDILYVDGYDVTKLPLIERKHILEKLFSFKDPLRFTEYRFKTAPAYFKNACKKGWEGLVVKDSNAPYLHKRSSAWLKFKCVANQELVIGGYTEPKGSRIGFGALLVGYYKKGKFHYAGKVGTGFNTDILNDLKKKFTKISSKNCPFINYSGSRQGINWVKPVLVCEVDFEQWTKDNKLRHSRYVGLRRDKNPKKVVQEI